jgi:hypothetical protein
VSGPNTRLKPKTNHITLRSANPKKICIKIETVFFLRKSPASKRPNAGIINSTRLPAMRIHAVSPESIGTIVSKFFLLYKFEAKSQHVLSELGSIKKFFND